MGFRSSKYHQLVTAPPVLAVSAWRMRSPGGGRNHRPYGIFRDGNAGGDLPPACRSPKSRRRSGSGLRFRRRPPGTTGTCSRRGRSPAARRRPRRCRFRRSASRPPMRCLRSPVRRNETPAGVRGPGRVFGPSLSTAATTGI